MGRSFRSWTTFAAALVLAAAAFVPCRAQLPPAAPYTVKQGTNLRPGTAKTEVVPPKAPFGPTREDAAKAAQKTVVQVDLLTEANGAPVAAQQWHQTFDRFGVSLRIRRAFGEDKIEVKESKLGPLRQVTAVGRLERDGTVTFPGRSFTPRDGDTLGRWIRDLQTYGAQGSPDGQPAWGLGKLQFEELFRHLGAKLVDEVQDVPLGQVLSGLKLPPELPLRRHASAAEVLGDGPGPIVRASLRGCALGTALATMLGDEGLGFRPVRTPTGSIELEIVALEKARDVWPVGWDPKELPSKTAPALFQLVTVGFEEAKLLDVLSAIETKTAVPVRFDRRRIAEKRIKLDGLTVSYPQRGASWSQVLRSVTNPHRLARKILVDEAGQPFVWITTLEPGAKQEP